MKHKDKDNSTPVFIPMALSSEDAARALGVSPKTLANWRCAGRGLPMSILATPLVRPFYI